jgi:DNA-binding SARP family transcriptional activator/predicted ATPase
MAALKLSLLGPFTVELDDQPLINFRTTKVQALLIYLAVEKERAHRREHLFTLLWPGMPEKSARHNLRQVLYTLRQVFPKIPAMGAGETVPLLLADRQTVQLNPNVDIEVDIHQLESLIHQSKNHEHTSLCYCESCIHALEQAIALYRDDFLADFYLDDSNKFEDWAETVRGKYRDLLLTALSTLAEICIGNQDYPKARLCIDRQLEIDNLRESAHHQLMETLALEGHRVEALRHHQDYVQMLESELNALPSQRMNDLNDSIRSGDLVERISKPETVPIEPKPPRNNLVPQMTPFIGRENELTRLDELLRDPDTRLITIAGSGGMGKTRLAIACAEQQLAIHDSDGNGYRFPDGVFFVPLADVEDPDQIPFEIAKALNLVLNPGGMMERERGSVKHKLPNYLRRWRFLLVLDNFEQLLDGGKELTTILQVAPCVQLLITSRERLHLHGEQVFPIDGLDYPDWDAPEDPCDYTAMQLFQESAKRVCPDFEISYDDMVPLTRICHLVGGMPLGLELAASWVDMLSVKQIAEEIQKSIEFLEMDVRDLPERHRSLRAVCDSTWRQLGDTEQIVFAQLSVFRGGFTREAALEVTGASIRTLAAFQSKSLIQYESTRERYRIHPYLRGYGIEQLKLKPEVELDAYDRHGVYYADFTNECAKKYFQGQTKIAVSQIDKEISNILEALFKSFARRNLFRIEQILNILCYYLDWYQRTQVFLSIYCEAEKILQKMSLNATTDVGLTHGVNSIYRVRSIVLNLLGYYSFYQLANKRQASTYLEESARILNQIELNGIDVRVEKAQLLKYQGYICDDYVSATPLFTESIALSTEVDDDYGKLECFVLASWCASNADNPTEAKNWLKEGLSFTRECGNQWGENIILVNLGNVEKGMGFYQESKNLYDEAISKSTACGDDSLILALNNIANFYLFLGDLELAENSYSRAIGISEDMGLMYRSTILVGLGIVNWLSGHFDKAEKKILTGIEIRQDSPYLPDPYASIGYIELLVLRGQYDEAHKKIKKKDEWSGSIGERDEWLIGRFFLIASWIELVKRNYDQAGIYLIKSIDQIRAHTFKNEWIAWAQAFLTLTEYGLGNPIKAKEILKEALSASIEIQGYIR